MAIFFDAPVEPDALTTFIREVPTPSNLGLSALFPTETTDNNTVDFAEIVRTNRTARYRSFDGRIHVSVRDTGSEKRVPLLPLSSSLSMGEYERLQLEFARTAGTNEQALARSIYNDAQNLTNEVQNRLEQAWGDVLTDGKLTITEGGLVGAEADFGVPASQIVSAGTVWSTVASATVLSDLVAWSDTYRANNGFAPGSMQTSQAVIRLMQRNAEIINAISGSAAGRTRVTLTELNDLLSSEDLPTLRPAYDTNLDVDGVTTRVIADDKLLFFPPNISDLTFEEAAGIVGVVEKVGPPYRQFTYVDAVAMPILKNAKLLMIADVK